MGDDCNMMAHRNEDDSPSPSSPKVAAAQRIKIIEESRDREIPLDERESLLLARQSGEPGEGMHKITDNRDVPENLFTEQHEVGTTEPLLFVPLGVQSAGPGFPYSETKLRPDAPPFTPESLTRSGPAGCGVSEISDTVCGEADFVPRGIIDDSCFVNVDLRSTEQDEVVPVVPKVKKLAAVPRTPQPIPAIRDLRDPIRDPGLKPFSLTSTPRPKRSPPRVETSLDSLHTNVETNETVAAESGANEPEIRGSGPESGEPRIVRGHWRILRTTFIIGNRIQIAVFIASIVLCVIIIIYVFV